jgi:hypothetical protein
MAPGAVDAAGNGPYNVTLPVPLENGHDHVRPIVLMFVARDHEGNAARSAAWLVQVRDEQPPSFLDNLSPAEATTGDPYDLVVRVRDNVALDLVQARYRYDDGMAANLPMAPGAGDTWAATVSVPHAWTALHYAFNAVDTSGNAMWSRQWDIVVVDNDAPQVLEDFTSTSTTTDGELTFDVQVQDNLHVSLVRALYTVGGRPETEVELAGYACGSDGNGLYRATVAVPVDASGFLEYVTLATDAAGNTGIRAGRPVRVDDDVPPRLGADLSDGEAWRGRRFSLDVEALDNIAVTGLYCEWRFGGGEPDNGTVPLDGALAIDLPLEPAGPLRYSFLAVDAAGNWARSGEFRRDVLNARPRLVGVEVWNVTEGVDGALDLRPHIEDPDDAAWSVSARGPSVIVDGYVLLAHHEVWVPDHAVELSIGDGRATTWWNITVHVVPVNDPPMVTGALYNGAPFNASWETVVLRRGRADVLSVQAWDEEGDPLSYRWLRHGKVVATGQELRSGELPDGAYDLTLEVSDGTDSTTFVVSVSVDERLVLARPWEWTAIALAVSVVLLAAALALVLRNVRRSRRDRP